MTEEQINELIPEIHEEQRIAGEWDDPCLYYTPATCESDDSRQSRLNAYLATKLDRITEAIVDAMRARREGRIWEKTKALYSDYTEEEKEAIYDAGYGICVDYSYEMLLTTALLRIMDLMGFYGVEYEHFDYSENSVLVTFRNAASSVFDSATLVEASVEHDQKHTFCHAIWSLLRIAELDNIDLEWHLAALRKYMEVSK